MPKLYSELQEASLENLSSDPSSTVAGRIYHNTTEVRVKTDDGTNKRALLRNDAKCHLGNNGTPANNIRLHRGGSPIIQFVKGDDATAEGTLSTSLAQTSSRTENYTNAGKPAAANAGRLVWLTDLSEVKVDTGSTYASLTKLDSIAPTTTKGDIIAYSTTNARLAVGTDGQVLKANSAQATGLQWGSAVANLAYRSVTTTDTCTSADDVLVLSGASFTENLFTAAGNTGKVLTIKHNGTSNTQVYTVDANGSETIDGSLTSVLKINGDLLKIISDGTNWVLIDKISAPTTFAGTKGGTQSVTANTTNITFTATFDSHSAWATDTFTAPTTGFYLLSGIGEQTASSGMDIQCYVNGSLRLRLGSFNSNGGDKATLAGLVSVTAADTITIRSTATVTLTANCLLQIHKVN